MIRSGPSDVRAAESSAPADAPRALSISGAAEFLRNEGFDSVTVWTIRRLINAGHLKSLKLGRKIFVTKSACLEMVERLERRSR